MRDKRRDESRRGRLRVRSTKKSSRRQKNLRGCSADRIRPSPARYAGQVALPGWLAVSDPRLAPQVRSLLHRLPEMDGAPIRIETKRNLRDRRGPVHAAAFLRERRMVFDCARAEFPRIFVHELFHFVWLRLGNPLRHAWEALRGSGIAGRRAGRAGLVGGMAQARAGRRGEIAARGRRWREYCCESFCDTAAWLYSGAARHPEFTLRPLAQTPAAWFRSRWTGKIIDIIESGTTRL